VEGDPLRPSRSPAALLIQNGTLDPISPRVDVLALFRAANVRRRCAGTARRTACRQPQLPSATTGCSSA
jgi:hypothetical protein